MEIVFVKTGKRSNFEYAAKIYKGRKVLNGFNKLEEELFDEPMASDRFEVQNVFFPERITADMYLSYPLSVVAKETIEFSSLHELISAIRKAYQEIYKDEEEYLMEMEDKPEQCDVHNFKSKYGIWGHSIYSLYIEAIRVLEGKERPLVEVHIGS